MVVTLPATAMVPPLREVPLLIVRLPSTSIVPVTVRMFKLLRVKLFNVAVPVSQVRSPLPSLMSVPAFALKVPPEIVKLLSAVIVPLVAVKVPPERV